MKRARKHLAIVACVILSMTSVLSVPAIVCGAAAEPAEPQVIQEAGRLRAIGGHVLSSTVPETLEVLYVAPEGKIVQKGDLLVKLDAGPLHEGLQEEEIAAQEAELNVQLAEETLSATREETSAAIELAEEALSVAQQELEAYLTGEYPMHEGEVQSAVTLAQQRVTYAKERMAAARTRHDKDRQANAQTSESAAPSEDLMQAILAMGEAESDLKAAENRLQALEIMHPLRKAQLKLAVNEKRMALMRLKNERTRTVLERQGEAKLARAHYEVERDRRARLHKWVNDCRLHAPRDGMVLHVRPNGRRGPRPEPDVRVRGGVPLVEVVDPHRFVIEVSVAPDVAQRIKPGQEATVRVDALPQERFEGRVTKIRPVVWPGGTEDRPTVSIEVEDPQGRLRVGMSARVELVL
jgi:multidrug resistance efflux pump